MVHVQYSRDTNNTKHVSMRPEVDSNRFEISNRGENLLNSHGGYLLFK